MLEREARSRQRVPNGSELTLDVGPIGESRVEKEHSGFSVPMI